MHLVRRVLQYEYPKYRKHLKALDIDSRVLRFGAPVKDEVIDLLCDEFEKNPSKHILFCVENINLEFVGVGHIALQGEMELAFSVLKTHRNQGIGDALIQRAVRYCRTRGILKGQMVCLSTNTVIKKLCAKNGVKMTTDRSETYGTIELAPADFPTILEEQASAHAAATDFFIKRAVNLLAISPQ